MNSKILFIIPPFTQLNTPYPSTAYLKGFLNLHAIESVQLDLGIETFSEIFTKNGLQKIFAEAKAKNTTFFENSERIISLQEEYIEKIEIVVKFLQNQNTDSVHLLSDKDFYPQASKFEQTDFTSETFGTMGIRDRAIHFASLFLDDLSDFITETVDSMFGFSRYAEHLALSPPYFDEILEKLNSDDSFTVKIMLEILEKSVNQYKPDVVAFSIPFPGNFFSALKSADWLKKNCPETKIIFGGGYINTELRSISDTRIFDFLDYITLDDGEAPLLFILEYLNGKRERNLLKRTFVKTQNKIEFIDGEKEKDFHVKNTGTPDYTDFRKSKYLSFAEVANPMHRLWSDGFWNKITLAHGCYWAKCSFCDTTLDYIKRYEPLSASILCDKITKIIEQTGNRNFHFTDEAAPPAILQELALELIRRRINISWWTNIRFEKKFTSDLCRLLKLSGCIAVTGGLEVASPRILNMINKGVTVEQVAVTAYNFTEAGIMVHAYLMYGFPTQTEQETVDSLETVRQLFEIGALQSAYWHRFAMTAHSPVGQNPEKFGVRRKSTEVFPFANNDVPHIDNKGANHEKFGYGLRKSLYNFMHGIGFDFELSDWFEFKIPKTKISSFLIKNSIENSQNDSIKDNSRIIWTGKLPVKKEFAKQKKGKSFVSSELIFQNRNKKFSVIVELKTGEFLMDFFPLISGFSSKNISFQEFREKFEISCNEDFELFVHGKSFRTLRENGLLFL